MEMVVKAVVVSTLICVVCSTYSNSGIQVKFSEDGIKRVVESLLGDFQETLKVLPIANISGTISNMAYSVSGSKFEEISGPSVNVSRGQSSQIGITMQFEKVVLSSTVSYTAQTTTTADVTLTVTKLSVILTLAPDVQTAGALSISGCRIDYEKAEATDFTLNIVLAGDPVAFKEEVSKMLCPALTGDMSTQIKNHLTLNTDIRPTACGKKMYLLYSIFTTAIHSDGILSLQGKALISSNQQSLDAQQTPIFPDVTMTTNTQLIFTRDLVYQLIEDNNCDDIFQQDLKTDQEVLALFPDGSIDITVKSPVTQLTYLENILSLRKTSQVEFKNTTSNEAIIQADVIVERSLKITFTPDLIKFTTHSWRIDLVANKEENIVSTKPNCELLKIYSNRLKSSMMGNVFDIPLTNLIPQTIFKDMAVVFAKDALILNSNLNVGNEVMSGEVIITNSKLTDSIAIKAKNGKAVTKCKVSDTSSSVTHTMSAFFYILIIFVFAL